MQFCSKSELYQSIKTCTRFGLDVCTTAEGYESPCHGKDALATVVTANIDPVNCGDTFHFPCWSSSESEVRRALQTELPSDWKALLHLPAFRNIEQQTFFDRPDTSKLSALLAGRRTNIKDAKSEKATDAEPHVSFADLFRKKVVPRPPASSNEKPPFRTGTPNRPPASPAPSGLKKKKKRSGLHRALFGEQIGSTKDGNTGGNTLSMQGGLGQTSAVETQSIAVFLPDSIRTKVELNVGPDYTMSRVIKVLLEQEVTKMALHNLAGYDFNAQRYELKLHDEDGYALEMAHNLSDQKVSDTGEDEFVLQRLNTLSNSHSSGTFAVPSTGISPRIKVNPIILITFRSNIY